MKPIVDPQRCGDYRADDYGDVFPASVPLLLEARFPRKLMPATGVAVGPNLPASKRRAAPESRRRRSLVSDYCGSMAVARDPSDFVAFTGASCGTMQLGLHCSVNGLKFLQVF